MLLELNRDEYQMLVELLKRRLDEIGPEERRSQTWHYKDLLHNEHAILERLHAKLQDRQAEVGTLAAGAE